MNILKVFLQKYRKNKDINAHMRNLGLQMGEDCAIEGSVTFGSEPYLISLGNHVRVNPGVKFITHDGGVWVLRGMKPEYQNIDLFGKITVGDNVHIGTDATIMPGVNIGSNCIIGCGAIVTRDIPDNSVAVGVPARVIESIEEYEKKNKDRFVYTKSMTSEEKRNYLKDIMF